jgi:hypothetical protein
MNNSEVIFFDNNHQSEEKEKNDNSDSNYTKEKIIITDIERKRSY